MRDEKNVNLNLKVNGKSYVLDVPDNMTLLEVLRDRLGLLSVKQGCGKGECGACTVILNGAAVTSCVVLAAQAQGADILTLESLAKDGELHPLQQSFMDEGAVQCGFCTPGMIMASKALLDEKPNPTEQEIKEAISGNLCRCTGYVKIVKAVETAAKKMAKE